MRISNGALQLLLNGDFVRLQSLSYSELLAPSVRQEMLETFLSDSFLETTQPSLQDAVSLSNVKDACVISSGHIFSQSILDDLLSRAISAEPVCPNSREVVSRSIAGSGRFYVLLPRIDSIISCFNALRAAGKEGALPTIIEGKESEGADAPVASDGGLEVQVGKGRIKLFFKFNDHAKNSCHQLANFLSFMLPEGEIKAGWKSYFMESGKFGRCWYRSRGQSLVLSLWFPPSDSIETAKRPFSDYHLNQILSTISSIINIPINESEMPPTNIYLLSALRPKEYIIAMEETPVTLEKMLTVTHRFLNSTRRTADNLKFATVDVVQQGNGAVTPSCVLGAGYFGSRHNILTTSSFESSSITRK